MKEKKFEPAVEIHSAEEEKNLFGEADQLYNTIHTEITIVNEEIEKTQKAVDRGIKKIEKLADRKENLDEAARIAKASLKSAPGKKPDAESF